jgi:hypothetical protein
VEKDEVTVFLVIVLAIVIETLFDDISLEITLLSVEIVAVLLLETSVTVDLRLEEMSLLDNLERVE